MNGGCLVAECIKTECDESDRNMESFARYFVPVNLQPVSLALNV